MGGVEHNVDARARWHDGDVWCAELVGHAVFGSDHYLMARNSGWSWWSAVAVQQRRLVLLGVRHRGALRAAVGRSTSSRRQSSAASSARRATGSSALVRRRWDERWYGRALMAVLDPTTMLFELWGWK